MKARILVAVSAMLVLLAMSFSGALPVSAAGPTATLWDCANGPSNAPGDCSAILGGQTTHGWNNTGNIGSVSHYNYGDVVPWRINMTGLPTDGASHTIVMTFDYGFVDGAGFAWDYMATWNKTVGGDPCFGTTLQGCSSPVIKALTPDPTIVPGTCPSFNPGFSVPAGNMLGYGLTTISSIQYLSSHTCVATTNTDVHGVQVTFTTNGTSSEALLVFGLHVATVADWGTVASTNQSPYHSNLVSFTIDGIDPGGYTTSQLQMKLNPTPTAVTLSKFIGLESAPANVTLAWTTATEINTAGFNIYRSDRAEGPYVRINSQLVPGAVDSLAGGKYQYQDVSVEPGRTYYYQLEDVELNGTSVRHDPIKVTASANAAFPSMPLVVGSVIGAIGLVGALLIVVKRLAR